MIADKKIKLPKKLSKKERKKQNKKRLKKYSNFLQKNYDWDYIYIIDLLRYKIKRVRKYIKKHNIIERETLDKIVSQMTETEKLLERIISNDYIVEIEKEFIEKFGGKIRLKTKFKKNHVLDIEHDYSEINENQIEEAKKEFEKILEREFELRKTDLKKAFELITENIWGWWD
jgi:DNA-directed RNA polymerase subunit H (RpoH/RPB5)